MMTKYFVTLTLFVLSTSPWTHAVFDPNQIRSAQSKQEKLWTELIQDARILPGKVPSKTPNACNCIRACLPASPWMTHETDLHPAQTTFPHTYGIAAKILLIMEEHPANPYTGYFEAGKKYGIIRFSLETIPSEENNFSFTPGFSLKLFVDEQPSLNVFATPTTRQGSNTNFFLNDFVTTQPSVYGPVFQSFSEAFGLTPFFTHLRPHSPLPLYELATIRDSGTWAGTAAKIPARMIFRPAAKIQIHAKSHKDFRIDLAEHFNLAPPQSPQFSKTLFHIILQANAEDQNENMIGSIVLDSPLVSSPSIDEELHFRLPTPHGESNLFHRWYEYSEHAEKMMRR